MACGLHCVSSQAEVNTISFQTGDAGTHSDTTFLSYSSSQVVEYARRRGGYPPRLIAEVVKKHASTGGAFGTLLDPGCGPGSATRPLAVHFDHAYGIDPSNGMITTAIALGGEAKKSSIQYLQGDAEECSGIPNQSTDLITAATAAHWFDMERFWPTAARILKPGGTVAFFTIWRIHVLPSSTPHAAEIQKILHELEQGTLGPYQKPGNWCLMGLYKDLQMPWSIPTPCQDFQESSYCRQVWNVDGQPEPDGSYVCEERVLTLDDAEKAIATISAVTRWREAHPELANTDQDCVVAAFAKIRAILGAGPDDKITMVGPSVLVTVKKG